MLDMENSLFAPLDSRPAARGCPVVAGQVASVSVPVTITPYVRLGCTRTTCCGSAIIERGRLCPGTKNGSCSYTITQDIRVAIPMEFGAVAQADDIYVADVALTVGEEDCGCGG